MMETAERLRVDLDQRSYDIIVGPGLIAGAGAHAAPVMNGSRAVIVTDETVAALYLDRLQQSLGAHGIEAEAIQLPPGEATKDFGHLERLVDELLRRKVERSTMVVALGGGVIGDLAGLAAAVTLRGLNFIQVPTTLLAQVDSSVGGKTGINTHFGKNLVGAFHQPRLVLADIGALETLPRRQLLAGYAEVVKYGLLGDADFFEWLEHNGPALINGDSELRRQAVIRSCAAKAAIVADDERELGRRALLNLGHTFGHALEAETGLGHALLHGEAVAIGMCLAFDLAVRLDLCSGQDAGRVRAHLAAAGLPVDMRGLATPAWTGARLFDHMTRDKKVTDGRIAFVLARGIGRGLIAPDVNPEEVIALLDDCLA